MEKDYKYLFKIIMIGNSSTGKTSLLHYYIEGKCNIKFNKLF